MKISFLALAVAVAVVALADSFSLDFGNFQFGKQGDNKEQADGDFLDSIKTAAKGIFEKAEGDANKFGESIKASAAGFFDLFAVPKDFGESIKTAATGVFDKFQGANDIGDKLKEAVKGFGDKFKGFANKKNRDRRDAGDEEYPETSDAISRYDDEEYPETSDAMSRSDEGGEYPEAVETSDAISGPVDVEEHNRERRAAHRGGKGKKPEGGISGHGHGGHGQGGHGQGGHGHGGHGKHSQNNATSTDVAPSVDAGNEDQPQYSILPFVGDSN